jgi:hypothetical protein
MENILIVLGILILGSAIGGTQLPKLPGAPLAFGAIVLAMFNGVARDTLFSSWIMIALLVILGAACFAVWRAEKTLAVQGDNASDRTKMMAGSIFQVLLIIAITFFFIALFFAGVNEW